MELNTAQNIIREFSRNNQWDDAPCIDKFDHLHEELVEMSQHLRYHSSEERKRIIEVKHDVFVDGIGDLLFGVLRLANQVNVDAEVAFRKSAADITVRYHQKNETAKEAAKKGIDF